LMFEKIDDQQKYIVDNFPEVTDQRIDNDHWDLLCTTCRAVRGFQLTRSEIQAFEAGYPNYHTDWEGPRTFYFRCPVCRSFKMWLVFVIGNHTTNQRYYRITSIPSEGLEEIEELPADPPALRTAYRQAIRAMDANAHIAAAAMFRRAVQVITRNILGAKPSVLGNELHEVVSQTYNGTTITANFAEVGYIVKEAGNQAAHPDRDPDLLDFTLGGREGPSDDLHGVGERPVYHPSGSEEGQRGISCSPKDTDQILGARPALQRCPRGLLLVPERLR
jgi:hypothetical protein